MNTAALPAADFQVRVAWLLQAAADAFDALQVADSDLDAERAVMSAAAKADRLTSANTGIATARRAV